MSSDDGRDGGSRDDVRSRANDTRSDDENEGGGESEWRFAVDDVGPNGVVEDTHTPESEPIEPGSIDAEHAVCVVLGVVLTIGVLFVGF
ncbi:hypothetical protein C471_12616 [Halorubrum saccharovorum DSM 1137]|uniref:DUF7312 domain-containing protein n=1 Tax=Halorubrum saccharovorum DSM 1137 TaxID=1227484 RepID=M0DTE2_9EURY|nr:hypothetical protein [Halorubrum saccharovorum]ELZ37947.1 hypothetical protein C471_12616 [Halorubrum saccharovorum DSM 1137]